ncbi:hypothetical protein, partial [Mariniflexile sp. HMF6888]|uniref:Ig-like domain-containing protein n=1 Tax=Mariniflexile sp. HMF6888 TaxID=3373086 RepID=UPI0037980516
MKISTFTKKKQLVKGIKQRYLLLLVLSFLLFYQNNMVAQIIFSENFGQSTVRIQCPYTTTGTNSFNFADPNTLDNPLTTGGNYNSNENIYANEIENNYYAVIAPANIYTTYASGYTPQFQLWNTTISDHTGNPNGAVMAINGGTTLNSLYKRQVALVPGKSYKLTFWLYVVNAQSSLTAKIISPSGNTVLASGDTGYLWLSSSAWTQYTVEYSVQAECNSGNYYISIENTFAQDLGNDFYIDDIEFSEISSPIAPVTIACPSTEPTANNDISSGNAVGSTVNVSILANDKLSDGTTTANTSNSTVTVLVPAGASQVISTQAITVPGEGTWSYAAGTLTFTPLANFTGNPTPITYTITDISTNTTSSPASVTITYVEVLPPPVAPVSGGNQTVCATSPIQTLTATATTTAENTIVWYDAATGGNIVTSPTLSTINTVTYYAEAVNTATGSVSDRTPVILTINPTPAVPAITT